MKKEKKVNCYGRESVFKRLALIPRTGCRWTGLIVIMAALMAGGFSNAYAVITTFPDMKLIDGTDPENVPDFYIGKYEVTYGQYKEFKDNENQYHKVDNCPVERVSWYDAADYCNALSGKAGLAVYYDVDNNYAELGTLGYRLPTEKEYYKAAASKPDGTTYYTYGFGRDTIGGQDANYKDSGDTYDNNTTPIGYYDGTLYGTFQTQDTDNQYGLYDMSGNVWEWNNDWHEAGDGSTYRVIRGGSWVSSAYNLASSYRTTRGPDSGSYTIGFRVASSIPEPSALLLFSPVLPWLFWYTRRKRRN